MPSYGMLRRVALTRTAVSEVRTASIIRMTRIGELGTLAVSSNRSICSRRRVFAERRCGHTRVNCLPLGTHFILCPYVLVLTQRNQVESQISPNIVVERSPQLPRCLRHEWFSNSNTKYVGSNPTRSIDVCVYSDCVVLCAGSERPFDGLFPIPNNCVQSQKPNKLHGF
jgi:hypothetical protein